MTGTVNYPQTPPAGGDHNPTWLNCGIYTSPVPNENAVHDLEHGAVWITYQPTLAKADIAKLTKFAKGQTYLDLSPYPNLPAPVVGLGLGQAAQADRGERPPARGVREEVQAGPADPGAGLALHRRHRHPQWLMPRS